MSLYLDQQSKIISTSSPEQIFDLALTAKRCTGVEVVKDRGRDIKLKKKRSFLGSLLFLIYINDLNLAIKYCKVHHFADNTNLLDINKFLQELNTFINTDLKNLIN